MSDNDPDKVSRTDCTPWRDEETLRYYYQGKGYSLLETAEVLGCTEGTVSQWCGRLGIETRDPVKARTRSSPDELTDPEKLRHLYHDKGLTTYEIAERVGYTPKGVHNWIVKHDIETRPSHGLGKEYVELECANCGNIFTAQPSRADRAKYCSRECYYEDMDMPKGPDHWSWKETPEHRPSGTEWVELRRQVRERDEYTCQLCGKDESEMDRQLDVHHLNRVRDSEDPRKQVSSDPDELISLCRSCHRQVEKLAPLLPPALE